MATIKYYEKGSWHTVDIAATYIDPNAKFTSDQVTMKNVTDDATGDVANDDSLSLAVSKIIAKIKSGGGVDTSSFQKFTLAADKKTHDIADPMSFASTVEVKDILTADKDANVTGNTSIGGTANIGGAATLADILTVTKDATLKAGLEVTGNIAGHGTLTVDGTVESKDVLTADKDANVKGNITVGGNATITGVTEVKDVFTADKSAVITGMAEIISGINMHTAPIFYQTNDKDKTSYSLLFTDKADGTETISKYTLGDPSLDLLVQAKNAPKFTGDSGKTTKTFAFVEDINVGPTEFAVAKDADLHTLVKQGIYHCDTDDIAATLKNAPTKLAFIMEVIADDKDANLVQRLTELKSGKIFIETLVGTTWSAWIDIAAGDSDKFLALAGGTMSGNIQLNNTIAVQGKDTKGAAHALAFMSKDDKAVFGEASLHTSIVSSDRPVWNNGKKDDGIAMLDDIVAANSYYEPLTVTIPKSVWSAGDQTCTIKSDIIKANSAIIMGIPEGTSETLTIAIAQANIVSIEQKDGYIKIKAMGTIPDQDFNILLALFTPVLKDGKPETNTATAVVDDNPNPPAPPAPTKVDVTPATLSVAVGAKGSVTIKIEPDGAEQFVDVSSSDATIATVAKAADGKTYEVTGVKAGTATITFAAHDDNTKKATVAVTVTAPAPPAPTKVDVDKATVSAAVGAKAAVVVSVEPAGADQTVDASSADATIATVAKSADGKSYEITGVKAGTVNVNFASHVDATKTVAVAATITAPASK